MKRPAIDERVGLRKKQRQLGEDVIANKEEIEKVSSKEADVLLEREKRLFDHVAATREACVDSEIFKNLSGFTVKQAYAIGQESSKVDRKGFIKELLNKSDVTNGGLDFEGEFAAEILLKLAIGLDPEPVRLELGKNVSVFFNSVSLMSFMRGPLRVEQKTKTRAARQAKVVHQKQKPLQIMHKDDEKGEKTEHQKFQLFLQEELKRRCGGSKRVTKKKEVECVDLFKFLTNPKSFTQTVENMFEFSFIVKDGWAGIALDKDDLPAAYGVQDQDEAKKGKDKQAIITFTMKDWEDWKEVYGMEDEEEGMLPHRRDKEYDENRAHDDSDIEVADNDGESDENDE